MSNKKLTLIIVGGGAGGLELVAKLCDKFKATNKIEITLIDRQLKHIWKPFFHEVAAGTYKASQGEIDYISYAYQKGFKFIAGVIKKINRQEKWISFESLFGKNNHTASKHQLSYDILILATGGQINDYNAPGVQENCLFLDSLKDAELCNQTLVKQIVRARQGELNQINLNIVGGGATGIELAAEFHYTLSKTQRYIGSRKLFDYNFRISVIEASDRILAMLPEHISRVVSCYLQRHKINLFTKTKIKSVEETGLVTSTGEFIESTISIWAAGIKGNANTIEHDLEINNNNQFKVQPTLQTTLDKSIFAFGDCASCLLKNKDGETYLVPPRAQAAQQQASLLLNSIGNYLQNKRMPTYQYKDYGSLISLSQNNVIGNLMSRATKNLYVEGIFARFVYWLLYKRHLFALKGFNYVMLDIITDLLMKKQRPEIKLH